MKCDIIHSVFLAMGDEPLVLTCDFEKGHAESYHYDELMNLCWFVPDVLQMAKKKMPPIITLDTVWRDLVTRGNGNT